MVYVRCAVPCTVMRGAVLCTPYWFAAARAYMLDRKLSLPYCSAIGSALHGAE